MLIVVISPEAMLSFPTQSGKVQAYIYVHNSTYGTLSIGIYRAQYRRSREELSTRWFGVRVDDGNPLWFIKGVRTLVLLPHPIDDKHDA